MTGLDDATVLRTLSVLAISGSVTIILGLLALVYPKAGDRILRRIENVFSRFAQRKSAAVAAIFLSTIALRLVTLPLLRIPVPGIHDEYSYLLMADTFAHGRLANPPHPMWVSFETFHVNWFPTYSSMYPPVQGAVLALGQVLGHPWIGVLLSDAAMCAAILWMLQAWLPARWAFLGGVLVALNFGVASYWMNSYWGGAVPAAGGAIVLGALARITRHARTRDALLFGLGVAILANSRPYEGFLFCIPAAAWFLWWIAGKTKANVAASARVRRVLLPLSAVLILTVTFMGYYDWRLTGNALQLPYLLNIKTYHTAQVFLWGHPKPQMEYRNPQFEEFYSGWEGENYHGWKDAPRVTWEKIFRSGATYFWVGELLLLPALLLIFRDRRMRLLLMTFVFVGLGTFALVWSNPHYAAPATCALFALVVQAVRYLRTMKWPGRSVGVALSRAAVTVLALGTIVNVARRVCDPLIWPCEGDPSRAAIAEKLKHTPGKHLIMVRYAEDHNIHDEWVFNAADLDGAKVLWARELDPEQNAKLFAYYKDRRVWLVTPDIDNEYLEPYRPRGVPLNYDSDSDR
jgi:hypothetical protein